MLLQGLQGPRITNPVPCQQPGLGQAHSELCCKHRTPTAAKAAGEEGRMAELQQQNQAGTNLQQDTALQITRQQSVGKP